MSDELVPQFTHSPLQQLQFSLLQQNDVSIFIKRDDLIHPLISGNKWRKLKYNLVAAQQNNAHRLLTFGGAYSNHLHAFAAACKALDFEGIAIVRGEKPNKLNPTLQFVSECGVQLEFVSRSEYRLRNDNDYLQILQQRFAASMIIPEGGSNELAIQGVKEIYDELQQQLSESFDLIATAVGSGGTLAGLISGLQARQSALGICALKGAEYLEQEITALGTSENQNWQLNHEYHHGGYARFTDELLDFMVMFKQQSGIELEPIYTGKLMYALFDLVERGYFPRGARIVALHTGGLQGLNGMRQRHKKICERL